MDANQQLIETFFNCFKNKDYKGMQACYAENAVFSDPVFKNLSAAEVKAMWQMLISTSKDLNIEFSNVLANNDIVTASWVAHYTFSKTGKKVVNKINSHFEIENGKIVKHLDNFNFYTWARQALGATGFFLGWTDVIKIKIQETAKKNLTKFMAISLF